MLRVLFGHDASQRGNSHVPMALCEQWDRQGWPVELTAPSCPGDRAPRYLYPVLNGVAKWAAYRWRPGQVGPLTEDAFVRRVGSDDVAYLWAGLSLEVFQRLADRGTPIVLERINCHQALAREALDAACARWRVPPDHKIDDRRIELERRKLELVDAVFCPSPMVVASLLDQGVPQNKLIPTSYGWSPGRFPSRTVRAGVARPQRFLFVGRVGVRKGVPQLIEAWRRAALPAELWICGQLEPAFQGALAAMLREPGVRHIPFTDDIGRLYAESDVFVFPSLEEGGPLVTYEAMAHGLLPVVSPMGAGAVVRSGVDGVVRDPWDVEGLAEDLRRAFEDHDWRRRLALNAIERVEAFTWERVAARRMAALRSRFPERIGPAAAGVTLACGA